MTPNLKRADRWIPWSFAAAFGVVLAANAALLYASISTFSGLDVPDPYRKGIAFDRDTDRARLQAERGPHIDLFFESATNRQAIVELRLVAKGGGPYPARAVVHFVRPTDASYDLAVPLTAREPGLYVAKASLPAAGQWLLRVEGDGEEGPFRHERRVLVRP
jgi:nitrogen fixation protein FixH